VTPFHRCAASVLVAGALAVFTATAMPTIPQAIPDTTDDHLEASLRPILPPFVVDNLRSVLHPRARSLASDLAQTAGILLGPRDSTVSTGRMLDDVTDSHAHTVDRGAYLRLRLFDLYIGDWSRTPAHISWTQSATPGAWQPVASAYRNPLPQFRGLIPQAVLMASESMTNFTDEYPPVERASVGLRSLDRRLLGGISPAHWDSVTLQLQRALVPAASSISLGESPRDVEVVLALRRRAATLTAASSDLRRTIDRWVALHGTDADDSIHVRVRQGHLLTVAVGPRGSTLAGEEAFFNSAGTHDLRLLLGRGDDIVTIEGSEPKIPVEVISEGDTKILSRTASTSTWERSTPRGVQWHQVATRPPMDRRDWGRVTTFEPWLDLDSDDGFFFGGGPVTTTYGFGLEPYAQRSRALVGIASSTMGVRAVIDYETREWWRNIGIQAGLRFAQADVTKFFGTGNETIGAASEADVARFEGRRRDVEMSGGIDVPLGPSWSADLHVRLTSSAIRADRGTVVDSLISSGEVRSLNSGTAGASIVYDTRGEALLPADAAYLAAIFEVTPAFLQNRSPYVRGALDAQWHLALPDTAAVIVTRFAGETFSDTPPWFESAAIGGSHSLRGYERERFRGNASILTGVEARIPAWTIPFIWPHETGFILFAETGRVFHRGEDSRRWHSSVGAGGWVRAVRSPYFASGTIARSPEDWKLSATLGFAF
jgi:hypothetical protein